MTFNPPVPSNVATGGKFTLSWTSTGVNNCVASGGSGSDGWTGAQQSNGSVTLTASTTPGNYNYTLTCVASASSNPSATATETVSGTAPGVPVFTSAFTATPVTPAGGSTMHFTWAVTGASSCSAVGGNSADGWTGSQPTTSPPGGVAVTAPGVPFSYDFGLICYGSAGSTAQVATVTISGFNTGKVPVFSAPFTATPSAVNNGAQFALSWASNTDACAAAGGDGSANWSGVQPASSPSGGVPVTAPGASGSWTYLLGCTAAAGSVIKQVSVLVGGHDCNIPGIPTTALQVPHADVTTATSGPLCLLCAINNPQNVTDADLTNYASIVSTVGLLSDNQSLTVNNDTAFPSGRRTGFVIANPKEALNLGLLENVSVSTFLNGVPQETAVAQTTAPLRLDLLQLGLIGTTAKAYLSFPTSKAFDAVQFNDGSLVSVLDEVDVYAACVSKQ